MHSWEGHTFWTALTLLVIPQVPFSFANSCLATADAARVYFGRAAERVRPGRLATSFGAANFLSAAIGGMPVCHGAGGMTAHYAFGARTGGAPLAMGGSLVVLAVGTGSGLAALLTAFCTALAAPAAAPRRRGSSWSASLRRPATSTSLSCATSSGGLTLSRSAAT